MSLSYSWDWIDIIEHCRNIHVVLLYKGTSNPFTCLFEQIQNIKDYLFTRCFISMIRNCLGYPLSLFVMKRIEKTYFAQYLLWQRFSVFLQCWKHEEYILQMRKHTQNTQESQWCVISRSTCGVNQPWYRDDIVSFYDHCHKKQFLV